jgi:succinoglycan biosynthesis protein ExoV
LELYYHKSVLGNFGDDLNSWLWDDLLPGWRGWDPDRVLLGVGTLISSTFLDRAATRGRRFLIAGAGVGYGDGRLPRMDDAAVWDVRSLRGPYSARSLGLPETMGVIDPAVMIATLPGHAPGAATGQPLFVPHESTVDRHDWATACAQAGIDYVSPREESRAVIARIATASTVLAESMHAAILADAYRVPWIPVRIGPRFLARKWLDWAASLAVPLHDIPPLFPVEERAFALPRGALAAYRLRRAARRPAAIPAIGAVGAATPARPFAPGIEDRLQALVEGTHLAAALRAQLRRRPYLSEESRLAERIDRYGAVLEGIRHDYA